MLLQSQIQSQLNALVMDLVQESRANRRVAEASFGRYRVTAICRMNGIRVQLFEGGSLLDVAWRQADPDGAIDIAWRSKSVEIWR